MKKDKAEEVEHDFDFQKAYDDVNHAFLEKFFKVYGFPPGTKCSSSK